LKLWYDGNLKMGYEAKNYLISCPNILKRMLLDSMINPFKTRNHFQVNYASCSAEAMVILYCSGIVEILISMYLLLGISKLY
jgi:hypothetical protein